MERPSSRRSFDDGVDRWTVASTAPADPLRGTIDSYGWWTEHTRSFTTRRELASTGGVFIVNLGAPLEIVDARGTLHRLRAGEGFVGGIAQATSLSRSTGEMAGVHVNLAPSAMARLLGLPLAALRDRVVMLEDVIGAEAARLGEHLLAARDREARWYALDTFLADRLRSAAEDDREIAHARHRLARGARVEAVAGDLGWSRKRLAQRFRDATGLHPRAFAGLARFERFTIALQADPGRSLAQAALDAGYADQAHLSREVMRYAALTPGALRRRLIPEGGGVRA